jgi:chromosome transmission fidelity protein 1
VSHDSDAEFLLDEEWDSDGGGGGSRRRRRSGAGREGDAGSDSDAPGGRAADADEEDEYEPLQVVFCSRTHSQLTQVVSELRRTRFGSSLRAVVLAGRSVLCVNDAVRALAPPVARLNDACRDLQKKAASKASKAQADAARGGSNKQQRGTSRGCPFLARRGPAVSALREAFLAKPMDVEDMTTAGKAASACPYYAARGAVRAAHIVFLPYAALVNQDMREALGLKLEGAVIIVDEAHNLPEAVADAHSAVVSGPALDVATSSLDGYLARYRSRLAAGNARHLATLLTVARALAKFLRAGLSAGSGGTTPHDSGAERVLRLHDFLLASGLDHVNMFKLARYCKERSAATSRRNIVHQSIY